MAMRRTPSGNPGPADTGGQQTGKPGQGVQRQQPQLPPQAMIPPPQQTSVPPPMSLDRAAQAQQTIGPGVGSGMPGMGGEPDMDDQGTQMMQQFLKKLGIG